ncbi:MAG: DEAD/DEAH box helicase family protein [Tepidisphaeraceae bacterium]|jgi:superfamily II DNA or RNA helicase/very-short-patch-repair endonuclease
MRTIRLEVLPATGSKPLPMVLPSAPASAAATDVNHISSPDAKIALFRSLFRGRDDIYPRRFESRKTGKAGYSPACSNEWVRGVCEKPRIKCAECPHRQFLAITDEVIRWHLSGQDNNGHDFVMGVYPMLLDETCFFLAADFDKDRWQEHATAFLDTCRQLKLPAALERSLSGRGAHIWLYFNEPIPATLARKLGAYLLTETMVRRPDIGLDSYDRFFPNQDTLPHGGFGNRIALPLQKRARDRGNTVFLDDQFEPFPDQWTYLSSIRKLSRREVEEVVRRAEATGHVVGVRFAPDDEEESESAPWSAPPSRRRREIGMVGPLPEKLELVLGNEIFIEKEPLSPALRNRLIRLAAFQNPEFYKAQAMRLSTYDKPRIVACAVDHTKHIGLPRGCLDELIELLSGLKIKVCVREERNVGKPIEAVFQGELRPEQMRAAYAMLAHDTGVLSATTAFGKTVIAAWLIAKRGVNSLILVHRRQLQEQWIDRLSTFLDLPTRSIGRIGGGRRKPTGIVDVMVIQSLVRKGVVDDIVEEYGHLIVDECHHLSAHSFELVARQAKAKYVTGLSATVTRKDGHHPIIFMQCGPVRHRVNAKEQAAARPFEHAVIVRPTDFRSLRAANPDARMQFQELYAELTADEERNDLICRDVMQAVRDGRSPIVLTERNDHLDHLASRLISKIRHLVVLRGGMTRKKLDAASGQLAGIPTDEERVLLATGRYVGEGFDDARLDTLFLTLPVSWHGTIAQYVGRLHRLYDTKREVRVYDYADLNVPMLSRMFDRRCHGYEAVGYTIQLPGSAVPGWPAEVPLPVDPEWKSQYAASVRRLVRDGVDPPLANLFVHVAKSPDSNAESVDRARSATEAFLFRRLETLRETAGCFRLNVELPIAFDGWGKMEVDLLATKTRLAIELDGGQHLADADAYRRDRRKDMLLQENGYLVLRFLAEDVGKRLDAVLDAILRALSNRNANQ